MKVALLREKGVLSVEDVAEPVAGPGQVIVKVAYCGICGTDLHLFTSESAVGGQLGHEWSGTVVEIGAGIEGWKVGDRVIPGPVGPCRMCSLCQRGYFEACDQFMTQLMFRPSLAGGFAERISTGTVRLFRIPESTTDEEAATIEPFAVAMHAVRESGVGPGESVVVLGGGPIGLCTLQVAKIAGASQVLVSEVSKQRAALAMSLGSDAVFDPTAVDVKAAILERFPVGPDVVFDCTGAAGVVQQSVDLVRRCGRVVMVGISMVPAQIDPIIWSTKEVAFKAVYAYNRRDYEMTIGLFQQGRVNGRAIISDVVPLGDIQETFRTLLRPGGSQVKVLVRP